MPVFRLYLFAVLMLLSGFALAQITVDISPDFKRSVGGVDSMDRSKFITVHADNTESDWGGNNFGTNANLRDEFLNGLDVYLGRNTGGVSWILSQVNQDGSRPGYASPSHLTSMGQNVRNNYANRTQIHPYEHRNSLIIAGQQRPFYPDGTLTGQGWALANGNATGEYMGRYVNEFFGGNGQPKPDFIEVMNEPLWEFVTVENSATPAEIFEFHNEVADAIRSQGVDVPIGGYCTAFTLFERDNFQRWHDRWKLFIDMAGENMDYWALHFYDFNLIGGQRILRRGATLEATFDMIEHYSAITLDEVKPFLISEFGGRGHDLEASLWTPERDWLSLQSFSSMWMTFMDRPNLVLKTIPFIPIKAEWGTQGGIPYNWRLMRRASEMPGETGDHWVYTDMVKIFELWSDVRGKRVETKPTDPDIQSDAYADGNKLYVIINNLENETNEVALNLDVPTGNALAGVETKSMFAFGGLTQLLEEGHDELNAITLRPNATTIITYTFENELALAQTSEETKYYAEEHLTPIVGQGDAVFHINAVDKPEFGEARLRVGFGRDHGKSLQPIVKVNGYEIAVPDDQMGYDQLPRQRWFGVKEITVPLTYLRTDNEVTVTFPDAGGHISSMSLRVFAWSAPLVRPSDVAVGGLLVSPASSQILVGQEKQLLSHILPLDATNHEVSWSSSNTDVATVDPVTGLVTGQALGTATITATTADGGFSASAQVEVVQVISPTAPTGMQCNPAYEELQPGEQLQILLDFFPIDAQAGEIAWSSSDPTVAEVDDNGLVTTVGLGNTDIIVEDLTNGLSDTTEILGFANFSNAVFCDLLPEVVPSQTSYEVEVDYTAVEPFDIAVELKDAENNWVGEGQVTVQPGIGRAEITVNCVSTLDWTTPVFPEPGEGYIMYAWMREVGGNWQTNMGNCVQGGITITEATRVINPELDKMHIFPNPSTGQVTISLPELNTDTEWAVLNTMGQELIRSNISGLQTELNLSQYPAGTYYVRLENADGVATRQVVLE
ncbi:MAG: Ig-like domain-containing protein [Bacteroidota bacterium]